MKPPTIKNITFGEDFKPERILLEIDASDLAIMVRMVGRESEKVSGMRYDHWGKLSGLYNAFYEEGVSEA